MAVKKQIKPAPAKAVKKQPAKKEENVKKQPPNGVAKGKVKKKGA